MSVPARYLPGKHPRRWIVVLGLGVLVGALGIGYLLIDLYKSVSFPSWAVPWIQAVTLQFIPRLIRGALFLVAGLSVMAFAWRQYGNPLDLK